MLSAVMFVVGIVPSALAWLVVVVGGGVGARDGAMWVLFGRPPIGRNRPETSLSVEGVRRDEGVESLRRDVPPGELAVDQRVSRVRVACPPATIASFLLATEVSIQ